MSKRVVQTANAPAAVGPYSQAIVANGFVFVSGQIPFDPSTGQLVTGSIVEQTQRVLDNVKAVLEAAGSGLDRVVKTTIYLRNLDDFGVVNEVYGRCFKEAPPARATVEVSRLPREAQVEIEAIALG